MGADWRRWVCAGVSRAASNALGHGELASWKRRRERDCASLTHSTQTPSTLSAFPFTLTLSFSPSDTAVIFNLAAYSHSTRHTYPPSLATHDSHSPRLSRPTGQHHRIRTTHSHHDNTPSTPSPPSHTRIATLPRQLPPETGSPQPHHNTTLTCPLDNTHQWEAGLPSKQRTSTWTPSSTSTRAAPSPHPSTRHQPDLMPHHRLPHRTGTPSRPMTSPRSANTSTALAMTTPSISSRLVCLSEASRACPCSLK
jgi:hypothetical protein